MVTIDLMEKSNLIKELPEATAQAIHTLIASRHLSITEENHAYQPSVNPENLMKFSPLR